MGISKTSAADEGMSRHHARLDPRRWERVRRAAFRRDGYRCTACGRAARLEGHHEPPLRDGADPYEVDGIVSLCRDCHIREHEGDHVSPEQRAWRELVAEIMSERPLT